MRGSRPSRAWALLLAALACIAATPLQAGALLISNVTVIDGSDAPPSSARSVLIEQDRITAIGDAASIHAPADAQRIDGDGKFLIPGLWDLHVHVLRGPRAEVYFPLLIAMGVTGVRDMGGDEDFAQLRQWRAEIADGQRVGPQFFAPGPFLDGPYPSIPQWSRVLETADEARTAVRELQQQGADFLKVYNRLPREAYFALAAEARTRGIAFAGHLPAAISAQEAARAGQKSIEHLFNLALACSSREDELMQRKAQVQAGGEAEQRRQQRRAYLLDALGSFDSRRCAALYREFVRDGTWQVPTLVQRRSFAYPESITPDAAMLAYVPRSQRLRWDPQQDRRIVERDAEDRDIERRLFELERSMVAPMQRAGVGLLAGTDAGDPYRLPGFSLHEELAELVSAGLTPLQALQSATRNAGLYFGKPARIGTIAVGSDADLVLLDANPLLDIHNTRAIDAVIVRGRLYDRAQRERLLAQARAAADAN